MVSHIDTNFFTAEAIDDPYSLYDQLRLHGDVVFNDLMQGWNVFGFDEVTTVLTDGGDRFTELNGDPELIYWFDAPNMITVDGPYHRRLRGGLAPLFTRSSVAKWEQRVREVVDELVGPLTAGSQSYDLIADFTMIPTVIVADMLGIPPERYDDFRRWSHEIVSNLAYGSESEEAQKSMRRASVEINQYILEEMDRHRREKPDDLFTAMLNLPAEHAMTDDEIRSAAVLLVLAGYDTTAKAMGCTLVALEQHPDQRRQVAADPSLVPAVIEESLRWCGPVQFTGPRLVMQDTTLGGVELAKGDTVFVFLAAANRDPSRWDEPNRFDVHRPLKSNLAFGWGPHLCLGAPLARLETKVAIEHLLTVAPDYSLRNIDYGHAFFVRGPEAGFIDVHPKAAV
jgi:cytochrome P450